MRIRARDETKEEELSILEARILAHPAVGDCAVMRRSESHAVRIVAYVVPSEPFEPSQLEAHLEAASPTSIRPDVFVPISTLPLTEQGGIDYEALSRVSVLEDELVPEWEQSLESNGYAPVGLLVEEARPRSHPLHLDDLLSNQRVPRSPVDTVSDDDDNDVRAVPQPPPSSDARLAIAYGGILDVPPGAPRVLGEVLERAAGQSEAGIHYRGVDSEDSVQSYLQLAHSADRILAGLRSRGLSAGDRVLLQLANSRDFLEGFWAAILGGFVPVPMAVPASLRQQSASQALERAWRLLGEPAVLTSDDLIDDILAVLDVRAAGSTRAFTLESLRQNVEATSARHAPAPEDIALLMLTSGSTGVPKAVPLTHRNLICRTLASIQLNGFDANEVSLNWMPLDHVAGLIYFHLRDTQLGCRQIQLATQAVLQNPLIWLDAIDEFRVSVTFAPNFAYGLVNDCSNQIASGSWDLASVRFVLNGAEAIVARTARRFLRLLEPHGLSPTAMHPAWGMSETSSGVTYSDRFSLATTSDEDRFVEVGRPVPGLTMKIVDGRDRIVSEGSVGRLKVKGDVVTRGYLNDESATRAAFSDDGWFETGDLAMIRDGRVTITGREKDVVIINGVNYYSHAIESVVEELEGVVTSFTAACAARDQDSDTDRLAVFFHPDSFEPGMLSALLKKIRATITSTIGIAPDYLVPVPVESIPKTSLGKIQRTLLTERLGRGSFDDVLKNVDLLTASPNTIPDWFFRKRWVRKQGRRLPPGELGRQWLVFLDGGDVGRRFVESVATDDVVVRVEAGPRFVRKSATSYCIDPGSKSDYVRLFASLDEAGIDPNRIVHLWQCRPESNRRLDAESIAEAQTRGSLSLLWLAQAIADPGRTDTTRTLAMVGSHVARVEENDRVSPERCPVLGFVKSISQEIPTLHCFHIDVDDPDDASAAESISNELNLVSKEREVAYRRGTRFVARLGRVEFRQPERRELPFAAGGLHLITGGLGGIGVELARFLSDRANLRVLLIGRSGLPLDGERETRLRSLAAREQGLAYESCDVTNLERLNEVVRKYESLWNVPLAGVVHLAGSYGESLVAEERRESFERLLAPRALGAVNIEKILAERGGGLLVTSSSVAGFFGGASMASYSAASAFLDGFHESLAMSESIQSYCFQWSNWDGIGQARSNQSKELPRTRGYLPISAERAILSFRVGLTHRPGAMLVGLDTDNRHVRRFIEAEPENLHKGFVYVEASNASSLLDRGMDLRDRFGVSVPLEILPVEALPLDDNGKVDRHRLRAMRRTQLRGGVDATPPATEAERELAGIWGAVLGAADVNVEDSFFELGGDSLLAVQALRRIRDGLGVELSLRTLFENPRLGELARAIDAANASPAPPAPPAPMSSSPGVPQRRTEDAASLLERLDELGDDEVDALLEAMADDDEASA
jgi:acyl-CoA synthetase (AMP-forming)/AMP-acid ligase II/NADP-dependent 3-hydroxy acid dehydrogenase YdfG/acyl carrier protein